MLRLLRPQHWLKNGFVFVGVLFGHAWTDPAMLARAALAALGFSFAASCVYVFNDYVDRERDRQHPGKRLRPLAAGTVSAGMAIGLGAACGVAGLALAWAVSAKAMLLVAGYLLLNLAYSLGLKHVAVLDVFIIAAGFMLRLLVGTIGLGIAPSQWLLLCGLMVTLFLGYAKRRAELIALDGDPAAHRRVLENYDPVLLDQMMTVCAAATVVSYSLYTLSPQTIALHGTDQLIWTVPFVLYGIFRYMHRLHLGGGGGDPASDLLRDPQLLAAFVGWLTTVVLILR